MIIAITDKSILEKYNLNYFIIKFILKEFLKIYPYHNDKYYNIYFKNIRLKFRVKDNVYKLIFVKEYKFYY